FLLKGCLVLQLDTKPRRNAPRKPVGTQAQQSLEGCAVKLPWSSVEKSAEFQLPGGRRGTSAQNREKPHHCGVQSHQVKILPERQTTVHLGFLPTTCQV
ncbi:unnamed protein product, partial [Gulo gulo]